MDKMRLAFRRAERLAAKALCRKTILSPSADRVFLKDVPVGDRFVVSGMIGTVLDILLGSVLVKIDDMQNDFTPKGRTYLSLCSEVEHYD